MRFLFEFLGTGGVVPLGFAGWFVFLVLRSSKSSSVTAAASWERIGGSLQGARGMNLAPVKVAMLARQPSPAI